MIRSLFRLLELAPSSMAAPLLARLDADQRAGFLAHCPPLAHVVDLVLADGAPAERLALARNRSIDRSSLLRRPARKPWPTG